MNCTQPLNPAPMRVENALAHLAPGATIEKELAGGASTRRFFRLKETDTPSLLMFAPTPSQELSHARQNAGNRSFIEMRGVLAKHNLPVPQIYSDEIDQCILVEDLGAYTLADYLKQHPDARDSLYQHAIECIAHARTSLEQGDDDAPFRERAFDEKLLLWEVEHFREWVFAAQGIELSKDEHQVFSEAAELLAVKIAALPRGFVHRDYQSRNLMVREENKQRPLVWIDFQDAMNGPRAYDLVALLTDSYQNFSREFIVKMLRNYLQAAEGHCDGINALLYEFDLISVQRKLKDAGRFIFTARVNDNPHFLQYVDRTVHRATLALSHLQHLPQLAALLKLIQRKLPQATA